MRAALICRLGVSLAVGVTVAVGLIGQASSGIVTDGLVDYFDADVGISAGGGDVTGWINQGPGNDVTVGDPETSIVAGPNGQSMIRFANPVNGAGLQYGVSGLLAPGYSAIAVLRLNDPIAGGNAFPRILRKTNDDNAMFIRQSTRQVEVKNGGAARPKAAYEPADGGPYSVGDTAILMTRQTPTGQQLYFNGVQVSSTGSLGINYGATDPWEIGNSVKGDIGSILVYDATASLADLHETGRQLASDYGTGYAPATPQPLIHWKFDGDYANSGTLGAAGDAVLVSGANGSAAFSTAKGDLGLDLDNVGSTANKTNGTYVKVDYQLPEQGTVMMWYYAEPFYNYQSIFDNSAHQDDWEMWIYGDARLKSRIRGTSGETTYDDLNSLSGPGNWYHIAYTWDKNNATGTAANLYVDGVLRASDDIPTWIAPGNTFYLAGGNDGNSYGNGVWDDVRIYDAPLSQYEILAAQQAELTPVLHWKLGGNLNNSGSGGSALDGTLHDDGGSAVYATAQIGQGLDLELGGNTSEGHYASVGYTLPDKGSMALHYFVEDYYDYQSIFDVAADANDWESWVDLGGVLHFRINDGSHVSIDLDNLDGPNEWYHVGVTWDKNDTSGSALRLYVDGALISVGNTTDWIAPGDTIFLGGGHTGNTYGNGVWDDFRIYDGVVLAEGGFAALMTIPEPGSLMLVVLGVGLLATCRRRRW